MMEMMNKFNFDENDLGKTFEEFMKYKTSEQIEYAKSNPIEICKLLFYAYVFLKGFKFIDWEY